MRWVSVGVLLYTALGLVVAMEIPRDMPGLVATYETVYSTWRNEWCKSCMTVCRDPSIADVFHSNPPRFTYRNIRAWLKVGTPPLFLAPRGPDPC